MMKQFDAHSPSKIEKIYSVRAMKIMLNQGRIGVQMRTNCTSVNHLLCYFVYCFNRAILLITANTPAPVPLIRSI